MGILCLGWIVTCIFNGKNDDHKIISNNRLLEQLNVQFKIRHE